MAPIQVKINIPQLTLGELELWETWVLSQLKQTLPWSLSIIKPSEEIDEEVLFLEKPKEEFVLTNLKIFDPSSFVTVKNEMLKFYE